MANSNAVWGIDIGQCALKALRCRPHEKDENRMVVEAFDYIEYPKILTQPEANREELIREALQQFVSRNDVAGESVAIAVPGQSGLARFIKLPPVERKKIPDIVKYEARQQIPFALEDVVWDYQPLVGSEDEGYAIETEVGLFAMKRDQVARALKPMEEAGVAVDIIQLAPLAIYNFICFDRLKLEGAYDPANPPPSTVIISLGTDTTDLVITNGYRVWQRSIPIGGNHFTKALTKELKLTFAKAEHLKRNAMKAENPKAVFQAMRPVFSDLVAEIQRSIGFFTSNNRNAKLGDMIALGNPMKLPGLQRFLSQNLDQEVKLVDNFNNLVSGSATASPTYKENQLTFGVAYGLCVQALDQAQLRTNLLPEEIITTRLVKAKKPWVVAAAALLMAGLAFSFLRHYSSLMSANVDPGTEMARQLDAATKVKSDSDRIEGEHTALTGRFDEVLKVADNLQSNIDGRLLWLELLKAVDTALPNDERPVDQRKENDPADIAQRNELHIEQMDCEYYADLTPWQTSIQKLYDVQTKKNVSEAEVEAVVEEAAAEADAAAAEGAADGATTTPPADGATSPPADSATPPAEAAAESTPPAETPAETPTEPPLDATAEATPQLGPDGQPIPATGGADLTKGGWVIQMVGHHFHNSILPTVQVEDEATQFVLKTLCKNLKEGTVKLPDGENGELKDIKMADLGIGYPVVVYRKKVQRVEYPAESEEAFQLRVAALQKPGAPQPAPGSVDPSTMQQKTFTLNRFDFIVQFMWQPTPRSVRIDKEKQPAGETAESTETAAVEEVTTPGT
jgi:type IV pilus assembly protein PilM